MNLNKLSETQKILDDRIVKEKCLEGQNLLDKKILALYTEIGELSNELPKDFKFWSNKKNNYERALKEYIDCVHFSLSIGIEFEYTDFDQTAIYSDSILEQFNTFFWSIAQFDYNRYESDYDFMIGNLIGLGKMLGFTSDQIEQAYFDKNKENHERQNNGY